jgi:hypothetical protein
MPRRAPEGLNGIARRGDEGMHRVFGGLRIALPKTPFKPFGVQDLSGMGWPFLWILSFGHAQIRLERIGTADRLARRAKTRDGFRSESIAVVGPRTDI